MISPLLKAIFEKAHLLKDNSHPWRRFFDGKGLIVSVAIVIIALGLVIAFVMRSQATGF